MNELTAEGLAVLIKALTIGRVSWDGDSWFASEEGYSYDEAEAILDQARRILGDLVASLEEPVR